MYMYSIIKRCIHVIPFIMIGLTFGFQFNNYEVAEGGTAEIKLVTNIGYDFNFSVAVDTFDIATTSSGKGLELYNKYICTCVFIYIKIN